MSREALETALGHARATVSALEALLAAEAPTQPAVPERPLPAVPAAPVGLQNPAAFFHVLRTGNLLGPTLSPDEVDGCEAITDACAGKCPTSWTAYCLATAFHETGGAMKPNVENLHYTTAARIHAVWPSRFKSVSEAGQFVGKSRELANHVYNGRMGNRLGSDDGWTFRGRGQVHITGRDNYARADQALGLNGGLVADPDQALRRDISARILVEGMLGGWFTGKTLRDYIPADPTREHFNNARRIVNGQDQADRIAGYALHFLDALKAGDWK